MDNILIVLNKWGPLFDLLLIILWSIYIFYTIRTFKQIKLQTDLQSEAFLVVASKIRLGLKDGSTIPENAENLHQKWYNILKSHIPDALRSERYIVLKLTNRGKSDIVYWNIGVTVVVGAGDYLRKKFNTSGEKEFWEVEYLDNKHNIAPGGSIEIPIANFGSFPKAEFRWDICYTDVRDKHYKRFGGDFFHIETNALANPSIKDKKPK